MGYRSIILDTFGYERRNMEERIKAIYNDCWAIYKIYLSDHDMSMYNALKDELIEKYGAESDITGILFWWAGRINGLHEEYERINKGKCYGRN